ncbi:MAG: hypothetical protein WCB10_03950 [Steroidobacteraceae bacterium]
MRDEAAALLLAAAVASSVTVALVLLLRSALRRIFGARVAYGAWTVPLVVVVTLLPAASAPAGFILLGGRVFDAARELELTFAVPIFAWYVASGIRDTVASCR